LAARSRLLRTWSAPVPCPTLFRSALGTVLFRPANHGTLQGDHGHASLIAGRISAVRIQASGSFRFVEAALGILGFHGVAVFRARSEEHTSALQSRFGLLCRLLPDR